MNKERIFSKRTAQLLFIFILFLNKNVSSNEKTKHEENLYEQELYEYRDKYHILDSKTFENSYLNFKKIPSEDRSDIYQATRKISSTLNKKDHVLITNDPLYLED